MYIYIYILFLHVTLSNLIHIIFRSVLLSMILNYKKIVLASHRLAAFHSQCQWTSIFVSLTTAMLMRTQPGFKRHRESHYSLQVPENYGFNTIISDYFNKLPFSTPTFMGARGAHKRHQGYNYSYQRVQNSYQLFRKS